MGNGGEERRKKEKKINVNIFLFSNNYYKPMNNYFGIHQRFFIVQQNLHIINYRKCKYIYTLFNGLFLIRDHFCLK